MRLSLAVNSISVSSSVSDTEVLGQGDLPVPTADPGLRGGSRLNVSLGLNLFNPSHSLQVGVEGGAPVWQDLDGPQLGTEWLLILGTQYSW